MRRLLGIALIGLLSVSAVLAQGGAPGRGDCGGQAGSLNDLPYQTIDDTERADLVFMVEEEKLARDVYRAFDDLWGLRIFRNIAGAEQTHMNALLQLFVKYGIEDTVGDAPEGEFTDPDLQQLYDQLLDQGSVSLVDALIVGATVEDLDIQDLEVRLARTDNEDIQTVYQNLQKGSRNHLRAFAGMLEDSGISYEPQYISVALFEEIVNSPVERGRVDANGDALNCPDRGVRRHRHQRTR